VEVTSTLAGTGSRHHAGGGVDRDTPELAIHRLCLADVDTRPYLDPERSDRIDDPQGTSDGVPGLGE
jgi:hypothetical protein